jgi:hypothetical protein
MKYVRSSLAVLVLALALSTSAHASVVWGTVVSHTGHIINPVSIVFSVILAMLP